MISRILTGAALTGMLLATGCGGGTSSGVAPAIGLGGNSIPSTSSHTRGGTASFSLQIPIPRAHAASAGVASSSRKPNYVSPGSSGIQVLLGNGAIYNANSAALGQQFIIGTAATPAAIPGSPKSYGPIALPTSVFGYASGATVTYTYAQSNTAGYYTMNIVLTGLTAQAGYYVGVVLTDLAHSNFVLSEGQGTGTVPAASAVANSVTIQLSPVLDGAYLIGGSAPVGTAALVNGPTAPSYEYGIYAADELGYPIPQQFQTGGTTPLTFDDGQFSLAVTSPNSASATIYGTISTRDVFGVASVLNPVPLGGSNNAGSTPTITNAENAGQTTALLSAPVAVGATLNFGTGDTPVVTAITGNFVTFTPALNQSYAATSTVTVAVAAANFLNTINTTGYTDPGALITNLAFAQTASAPTLAAAATGYRAGHALNVLFAAPGTYTVATVAAFSTPAHTAPNGLAGYPLTTANYPPTGSYVIGNTSTVTIATGLTTPINSKVRQ